MPDIMAKINHFYPDMWRSMDNVQCQAIIVSPEFDLYLWLFIACEHIKD